MTILIRPFSGTPRSQARWAAVLLASVAMAMLLFCGVAPAQATTQAFTYTGGEQTFVVPAGVFSLHVVAIGGGGGAAGEASGGVAAEVVGNVNVTPGQTLYVEVGGRGKNVGEGGTGGFNGGGSGAGGGGGASDVRTSPLGAGLVPDRRLIVAAGGGGGGGSGPTGIGTAGGAAGSPGVGGEYAGGGAGTESVVGTGAAGCESVGESGQLGLGGAGGDSGQESDPGGGGGGGYYGGGGGGGACHVGSSGGGGGSSLVPLGGSLALALLATEPQIQLSYMAPSEEKVAPNTVLGFHPPKKIKTKKKKVKVKFTFSSNVAGATFKCKLDKGAFAPCTSPKSYKVKPGKHKFSVEAVSAGGTDSSPATFGFSVKKKH